MTEPKPDRFASLDEMALGDEVWVYARCRWRKGRVIVKRGRRVIVLFRIRFGVLRRQAVALDRLRRPEGALWASTPDVAPTDEEILSLAHQELTSR